MGTAWRLGMRYLDVREKSIDMFYEGISISPNSEITSNEAHKVHSNQ